MRHSILKVVSSFAFLAIVAVAVSENASAQSLWQKMKQSALQQECQSGNQKACQDLAKLNQKISQETQKPPAQQQPTPDSGQNRPVQPAATSAGGAQDSAEPWTPPADDSSSAKPVKLDPTKMPDIIGLRLGMTAQEALEVSHKTYPGDLYAPTIANWWPSAEKPDYGYNVLSRLPGNNKDVVLSFTAPPGNQLIWKIERQTQRMHTNRNTLIAALREKYGKETVAFTNNGSGVVATSDASIGELIWLYDESGARTPLPPLSVINMQNQGIQGCVASGGVGEPTMPKDDDWGKTLSEWCAHHLVALSVMFPNMDIIEYTITKMEDVPLAMRTSHAAAAWLRDVAQKQHQEDLEKSKENKPVL